MQVTVGSTIQVKDPPAELMEWCNKNLKLSNPEYGKKLRMHFWLGNTPAYLYLYEMRGDTVVLPFGTLREIIPFLDGATVHDTFGTPTVVDYGSTPIPLYDYQQDALRACMDGRYGILQSKAGSGKTQIGIAIIREYERKALWLVHTADLLKQSKERAEMYMDKDLMGTITEGKVNIGKGITFATVQTMSKLDLSQYRDEWDVIITDEVHRVSGSPTAVTQYQRVLNSLAARHKYGLSATVHRSDGMIAATYALVGRVIYTVPDEAVADKVMKVGVYITGTGVKIARVCLNSDGTINYQRLITYLTENDDRNKTIVNAILDNADRPSLILSDRLEHLETLMGMLPGTQREKAVMISGEMTSKVGKAEREKALDDMRVGTKKYLFATYALAKEGLDIPCLERLYMTTPVKDYAVVTQSIGRIARMCADKDNPLVYDFVDDIAYLVRAYTKRCSTYRKNGCYFV